MVLVYIEEMYALKIVKIEVWQFLTRCGNISINKINVLFCAKGADYEIENWSWKWLEEYVTIPVMQKLLSDSSWHLLKLTQQIPKSAIDIGLL